MATTKTEIKIEFTMTERAAIAECQTKALWLPHMNESRRAAMVEHMVEDSRFRVKCDIRDSHAIIQKWTRRGRFIVTGQWLA